jgi:hypothetical protein
MPNYIKKLNITYATNVANVAIALYKYIVIIVVY